MPRAPLVERERVDVTLRHQLLDERAEAGAGLEEVVLHLHVEHVDEAQAVVEIVAHRTVDDGKMALGLVAHDESTA